MEGEACGESRGKYELLDSAPMLRSSDTKGLALHPNQRMAHAEAVRIHAKCVDRSKSGAGLKETRLVVSKADPLTGLRTHEVGRLPNKPP